MSNMFSASAGGRASVTMLSDGGALQRLHVQLESSQSSHFSLCFIIFVFDTPQGPLLDAAHVAISVILCPQVYSCTILVHILMKGSIVLRQADTWHMSDARSAASFVCALGEFHNVLVQCKATGSGGERSGRKMNWTVQVRLCFAKHGHAVGRRKTNQWDIAQEQVAHEREKSAQRIEQRIKGR